MQSPDEVGEELHSHFILGKEVIAIDGMHNPSKKLLILTVDKQHRMT